MSGCVSLPRTFNEAMLIAKNQKSVLLHWVDSDPFEINVFDIQFAACLDKLAEFNITSQKLVLGLNKNGNVYQAFLETETEEGRCLVNALNHQQFPNPPIFPAYLLMEIDFKIPDKEIETEPFIKDVLITN